MAKWIEVPLMDSASLIRKEFNATDVKSATIKISGLGLFYLYINGNRVSDDLFVPAWTDYHKRELNQLLYPINDTFTHRIYYMEYDVKNYLAEGNNALGIMLGNGWYNQFKRNDEGFMSYGYPRLFFVLTIEQNNGEKYTICSDETLKWNWSYITANSIHLGETQDYTGYYDEWLYPGFDDSWWQIGRPAKEYDFIFEKQTCPADKIIREIQPTCIADYGDKKVYDLGENITGWVRLKLNGKKGKCVTVCFAEEVNRDENITLNFNSAGGENQIQTDKFICDGTQRIVEPYFTFHGFRYFEVTGNADVLCGVVVHTPIEQIATFNCDNENLNWFFNAYVRSQLTNIHMCIPSDCPTRERLGYTGDGQITAHSAMTVFDVEQVHKKWIRDILDCQDINNGHIQHTAPFYGGGGGPGGWGCAVVTVPYMHYLHYRDKSVLEDSYDAMQKWIGYMQAHSENGIVVREEEYGWCLGDWCTPDVVEIPESFVNTYYLVKSLERMKAIAPVINRPFVFDALLKDTKAAMVNHFFDDATGSFLNGIQGADAFALDIGLGDERTLSNLAEKYNKAVDFDTGIFGTEILVRVLFENNYGDIALKLLTSKGDHSFYTMMQSGATTLYETWGGYHAWGSHNHPMFGGAVAALFSNLAGVKVNFDGTICLAPAQQSFLNEFDVTVKTHLGTFEVAYKNDSFAINSPVDTYMLYAQKQIMLTKGVNNITC